MLLDMDIRDKTHVYITGYKRIIRFKIHNKVADREEKKKEKCECVVRSKE